ncbi:hypothetical protein KGQ27_03385 [Patescibacteria group bacterium]|nr:hypothetical protein [Patescibacteria group bacterium]MDE1946697.1 hypothetical protein [Patescibacteria group bacterium]MDE2011000.1 hypothetical protein [Patescibacteria group bacterium]MDE2232842.1 hypothetical protein [Patescibacteria group bacterium]
MNNPNKGLLFLAVLNAFGFITAVWSTAKYWKKSKKDAHGKIGEESAALFILACVLATIFGVSTIILTIILCRA